MNNFPHSSPVQSLSNVRLKLSVNTMVIVQRIHGGQHGGYFSVSPLSTTTWEIWEIFNIPSVVVCCISPLGNQGYIHNALFLIMQLVVLRCAVKPQNIVFCVSPACSAQGLVLLTENMSDTQSMGNVYNAICSCAEFFFFTKPGYIHYTLFLVMWLLLCTFCVASCLLHTPSPKLDWSESDTDCLLPCAACEKEWLLTMSRAGSPDIVKSSYVKMTLGSWLSRGVFGCWWVRLPPF